MRRQRRPSANLRPASRPMVSPRHHNHRCRSPGCRRRPMASRQRNRQSRAVGQCSARRSPTRPSSRPMCCLIHLRFSRLNPNQPRRPRRPLRQDRPAPANRVGSRAARPPTRLLRHQPRPDPANPDGCRAEFRTKPRPSRTRLRHHQAPENPVGSPAGHRKHPCPPRRSHLRNPVRANPDGCRAVRPWTRRRFLKHHRICRPDRVTRAGFRVVHPRSSPHHPNHRSPKRQCLRPRFRNQRCRRPPRRRRQCRNHHSPHHRFRNRLCRRNRWPPRRQYRSRPCQRHLRWRLPRSLHRLSTTTRP